MSPSLPCILSKLCLLGLHSCWSQFSENCKLMAQTDTPTDIATYRLFDTFLYDYFFNPSVWTSLQLLNLASAYWSSLSIWKFPSMWTSPKHAEISPTSPPAFIYPPSKWTYPKYSGYITQRFGHPQACVLAWDTLVHLTVFASSQLGLLIHFSRHFWSSFCFPIWRYRNNAPNNFTCHLFLLFS